MSESPTAPAPAEPLKSIEERHAEALETIASLMRQIDQWKAWFRVSESTSNRARLRVHEMEMALEFYADPANCDGGERARTHLRAQHPRHREGEQP